MKVQSGGSFDIDYSVVGPGEKVIMEGTKERQGDFVFTAQSVGEYRFCFNNEMSTFAEKMVDFEIAVSRAPFTIPLFYLCWIGILRMSAMQLLDIPRMLSTLINHPWQGQLHQR